MKQHSISIEGSTPKRLIWLTDLHLDAVSDANVDLYFATIASKNPDALLIGGDISNGPHSFTYLKSLQKAVPKPLYFVLGNHDYYFSSIQATREEAQKFEEEMSDVTYLTNSDEIRLNEKVALIGHDGWSDARAGDFLTSTVKLNDYIYIDDLRFLTVEERMDVLHTFGDVATQALQKKLTKAFQNYSNVVVLTHTPPFEEASCYGGKVCDANWAPHFVCASMGEMLLEMMEAHPDKHVTVLCGHAHYGVEFSPATNLRVVTGHSDLGTPTIQGILSTKKTEL